jgi:hypothetical protein
MVQQTRRTERRDRVSVNNRTPLVRHVRAGALGRVALHMITTRKGRSEAFVTNELFIVAAILVLAALGALVVGRTLHLGWLLSIGAVTVVLALVALILSCVFTPRK